MFCYITGYFFSVLVVVQKKRGLSRFLPKVSCALKTGSKKKMIAANPNYCLLLFPLLFVGISKSVYFL